MSFLRKVLDSITGNTEGDNSLVSLAKSGDPESQFKLAQAYDPEIKIVNSRLKKDSEIAMEWYRKAANAGYADAQFFYAQKMGINGDMKKCRYWLQKAINQGHQKSKILYETQLKAEIDINFELGALNEKSIDLIEQGVNIGYSVAQRASAEILYNGYNGQKDIKKSIELYTSAANQGDIKSQANLGIIYYVGEVVQKDYIEAVKWWKMAANNGDAQSQFNLGKMYWEGNGVEQSDEYSIMWVKRAADQGHDGAIGTVDNLKKSGYI